jgi:quercetin dioxygenase-like cupin family protein
MKRNLIVAVVVITVSLLASKYAAETKASSDQTMSNKPGAIFTDYQDFKWNKILPDLGDSSPEIAILHIDTETQATKLAIRIPKGIHVRKHWHSANETHTIVLGTQVYECEGKRVELGPGSFNYLPAKMVHEAWLPAGSLAFITVDGAWDVNWVEGPPTAADLTK